jgi:Zn finger protein HypA/HybF involved in hydrogenase expression
LTTHLSRQDIGFGLQVKTSNFTGDLRRNLILSEKIASSKQNSPAACRDCLGRLTSWQAKCPKCGSVRVVSHPRLFDLTVAHIDCDAFYASIE